MERDFSKFGVSPQPKMFKMILDERELDLLRMSVKALYSHFCVRSELCGSSKRDAIYGSIISELKELYWKIYNFS